MFADRFKKILEYLNKSVIDISKDLGYSSPEKIYRFLRANDPEKESLPSFEFLRDLSTKFDFININWLLTGNGEMFAEGIAGVYVTGDNNKIKGFPSEQKHGTHRKLEQLEKECEQLHAKIETMQQLLEEKERVISAQKELSDILKENIFNIKSKNI